MTSEPESKARAGKASSALLILLQPVIALLSYSYAIPKFFVTSLCNIISSVGRVLKWPRNATLGDDNVADMRSQINRTK
ncbi:hypothetical protein AAVH_05783 [Aphelenchoides avenae]|nr:hypothetical protein AAVH_05783 [Aphelenchus avenae]